MGESKLKQVKGEETLMSCAGAQTGGWASASSLGEQTRGHADGAGAYFIEFLTLTGLWSLGKRVAR